jgi:hypothetical protein
MNKKSSAADGNATANTNGETHKTPDTGLDAVVDNKSLKENEVSQLPKLNSSSNAQPQSPIAIKATITAHDFDVAYESWIKLASLAAVPPALTEKTLMSPEDRAVLSRQWDDCGEVTASRPIVVTGRKQWQEVRLFISSTFADYFAEREVIVKQVVDYLLWS